MSICHSASALNAAGQSPYISSVSQPCIANICQPNLNITEGLHQILSSNLAMSEDGHHPSPALSPSPLSSSQFVWPPPSVISIMPQLLICHHPLWAWEGHAALQSNRELLCEASVLFCHHCNFLFTYRNERSHVIWWMWFFFHLQTGIQRMRSSIDGSVVRLRLQTNDTGGFTNLPLWVYGTLLMWHTLSLVWKNTHRQ